MGYIFDILASDISANYQSNPCLGQQLAYCLLSLNELLHHDELLIEAFRGSKQLQCVSISSWLKQHRS